MRKPDAQAPDSQRLDFWLWCARFARARTSCAELAQAGLIRINRQRVEKAHAQVRRGDILTLPAHPAPQVRVVEILALADRRGSAADAGRLYREIPDRDAAALRP